MILFVGRLKKVRSTLAVKNSNRVCTGTVLRSARTHTTSSSTWYYYAVIIMVRYQVLVVYVAILLPPYRYQYLVLVPVPGTVRAVIIKYVHTMCVPYLVLVCVYSM